MSIISPLLGTYYTTPTRSHNHSHPVAEGEALRLPLVTSGWSVMHHLMARRRTEISLDSAAADRNSRYKSSLSYRKFCDVPTNAATALLKSKSRRRNEKPRLQIKPNTRFPPHQFAFASFANMAANETNRKAARRTGRSAGQPCFLQPAKSEQPCWEHGCSKPSKHLDDTDRAKPVRRIEP